MTSMIYSSKVAHIRHEPVFHSFVYPILMFGIDLDDLQGLDSKISLFGHNRRRPVSIHDADYLLGHDGSIKTKLLNLLRSTGVAADARKFFTITMPRIWGYSFNPVSLHLVYDDQRRIISVIADVNNTFRERHVYILTYPEQVGAFTCFRSSKVFHVSPFFDRNGTYEFWFSDVHEKLDIRINLFRNGKLSLSSHLWGESRPLTSRNLALALTQFPLNAFLTLPRIMTQAARLYYSRKLPVYTKPEPASQLTISTAGFSFREKAARRLLHQRLSLLAKGMLTIIEPDGERTTFEGEQPGRQATIHIRAARTYWRTLVNGDIGFGESYMKGEWTCEDLPGLLLLLLENRDELEDFRISTSFFSNLRNCLVHHSKRNTPWAARKNIHDHYDLGNSFFQLFLDETMTYSCAEFTSSDDTLEQAQLNKIHNLLQKADLSPCHNVLEIGCGWGALSVEAIRKYGCQMTCITLSEQQITFARERFQQQGVEKRIELKLQDYREVTGCYDRIISVEMLEAVGREYFDDFFRKCDRLLKPGGRVVLQVITIDPKRYEAYSRGCDWIQKYIFPGGFLPSLPILKTSITASSSLEIKEIGHLGHHYVRTLQEWRHRFDMNHHEFDKLGLSSEFQRKWEYYFAYCEAGFSSGALDVLQIVLDKPGGKT